MVDVTQFLMNVARVEDKQFARLFAVAVETELLTHQQYYPWADALILALDEPPCWILQLAVTRESERAASIIREFAWSSPYEEFTLTEPVWDTDLYVASWFLRYENNRMTWPQFLWKAGDLVDASGGFCEYFFDFLNQLEECHSGLIEQEQRIEVEQKFQQPIERMEQFYLSFLAELPS